MKTVLTAYTLIRVNSSFSLLMLLLGAAASITIICRTPPTHIKFYKHQTNQDQKNKIDTISKPVL